MQSQEKQSKHSFQMFRGNKGATPGDKTQKWNHYLAY